MTRTKQADRKPRALEPRQATVPIVCPVCKKPSSQCSNLERHMAVKHHQRMDGLQATKKEIQRAWRYNIRGHRAKGRGGRTQVESERPEYKSREYFETEESDSDSADSESSDTTPTPPRRKRIDTNNPGGSTRSPSRRLPTVPRYR